MVCEHLSALERELVAAGVKEAYRGQPWSSNCREWVYFDCLLDRPAIRLRIPFAECVKDHVNTDSHSGTEAGFVCSVCHDGIIGLLEQRDNTPVIH